MEFEKRLQFSTKIIKKPGVINRFYMLDNKISIQNKNYYKDKFFVFINLFKLASHYLLNFGTIFNLKLYLILKINPKTCTFENLE